MSENMDKAVSLVHKAKKMPIKLLAISGSAREASTNTVLLNAIKGRVPLGAELSVFYQLNTLPVFSPDFEGEKTGRWCMSLSIR